MQSQLTLALACAFCGVSAQDAKIYATIDDDVNGRYETATGLRARQHTDREISAAAGADFEIVSENAETGKRMNSREIAFVEIEDQPYVHLRTLKSKGRRKGYAQAFRSNEFIFFQPTSTESPSPYGYMGGIVGGMAGGIIGAGISAALGIGSDSRYYCLNLNTGKSEVLNPKTLLTLLNEYPDLQGRYLEEKRLKDRSVQRKYLLLYRYYKERDQQQVPATGANPPSGSAPESDGDGVRAELE